MEFPTEASGSPATSRYAEMIVSRSLPTGPETCRLYGDRVAARGQERNMKSPDPPAVTARTVLVATFLI